MVQHLVSSSLSKLTTAASSQNFIISQEYGIVNVDTHAGEDLWTEMAMNEFVFVNVVLPVAMQVDVLAFAAHGTDNHRDRMKITMKMRKILHVAQLWMMTDFDENGIFFPSAQTMFTAGRQNACKKF
jgi:hypothetical protein